MCIRDRLESELRAAGRISWDRDAHSLIGQGARRAGAREGWRRGGSACGRDQKGRCADQGASAFGRVGERSEGGEQGGRLGQRLHDGSITEECGGPFRPHFRPAVLERLRSVPGV